MCPVGQEEAEGSVNEPLHATGISLGRSNLDRFPRA